MAWHDVEHGSYDADLPLWRELAAVAGGPVLDLGAGTGRVAVDLAARGHDVVALDTDAELLAELAARAPSVATVEADARSFALGSEFALIIAPMQLVQIIGGHDGRVAMLERVHAHLGAGGAFAAALAEPRAAIPDDAASPPLPDMLERDGWVFSSQPVSVSEADGSVIIERQRQAVSPAGEIEDETAVIALDLVDTEQFEDEARAAGLEPVERRAVAETLDHIGSTVVLCRR
ncbi:MAG TPA: class I SAM-dependent methyltransferase [Thermoleophilaceae bacterium]